MLHEAQEELKNFRNKTVPQSTPRRFHSLGFFPMVRELQNRLLVFLALHCSQVHIFTLLTPPLSLFIIFHRLRMYNVLVLFSISNGLELEIRLTDEIIVDRVERKINGIARLDK